MKPRKNEKIGGGFFVFKRNCKNSRVYPSKLPFEHSSIHDAIAEAERLAEQTPCSEFFVFAEVARRVSREKAAA